jgi:hypothetical protein
LLAMCSLLLFILSPIFGMYVLAAASHALAPACLYMCVCAHNSYTDSYSVTTYSSVGESSAVSLLLYILRYLSLTTCSSVGESSAVSLLLYILR